MKSAILSSVLLAATLLQAEAAIPLSQELRSRTFKGGAFLGSAAMEVRGGARKKSRTGSLSKPAKKTVTGKKKVGSKEKAKSAAGDLAQKYNNLLPLTRIHLTTVAVCTLSWFVLGDELTQAFFALEPTAALGGQFWRFFTAASYLGKPSISSLMSGYYVFEYGTTLERAYGEAQYLVFLLAQIALLSFLSIIFKLPFFAGSMVTSMLHVLSRAMPHQKVRWLIFTVPYWALPYGLMITDVLQAQSAAAAMPHILGILSGHFYHFQRFIWPKTGGEDWLTAPDFLIQKMDPDSDDNTAAKKSISKALKSRKKGKGKKLGSK